MSADQSLFAGKVTEWQRVNGRHDLPWQRTRDPYRLWVSEIMLQQTQVVAVIGYFERFMNRFPDIGALAQASEDEVLRLWSGLGYYARARNLHKAARTIVADHGGEFPQSAQMIQELPGIGRSTASAIAAFAYSERVPILDGNVKRVLARCFGIEGFPGAKSIEDALWRLAEDLLPAAKTPSSIEAYTQGLMDLGATVCTRHKPACGRCPLAGDCVAKNSGRTEELPTARPRKRYPSRETTWIVLRQGEEVLLERRPSPGIWGGLWSFPEFSGDDLAGYCFMKFNCEISQPQAMPVFAHGFTHFRLEISPLICAVSRSGHSVESPAWAWMGIQEAIGAAVPVPVRKVLNQL